MKKNHKNNLVANTGEYFVCAELCRLGFLALLTPKNNPLFDIVVTDPEGRRSVSIQVKTRSVENTQGWKMGVDMAEDIVHPGLFVVLVNLEEMGMPEFYIYEHTVICERVKHVYQEYINKPKRDGSPRKAVGFRWFDEVSFTEDDHARRNNWNPIINTLIK